MTREEASKVLEYLATDTTGTLAGTSDDYAEFLVRVIDALDMGIAALREQEERSKGCGHCLSEINKDMMLAHGFAYCTDCGRRLEEVCM